MFLCLTSFSAFAEDSESVLEGYCVDDVPYNASFETVLTASDDGSQLYSAASNSTYNTPAVLSATTNSSALYYYSNIYSGVFTTNNDCFRATNMTYKNLGTSVQFNLTDTSSDGQFYSRLNKHLTEIKSGRKYRFSFTIVVTGRAKGDVTFKLKNSLDSSDVFTLFLNSAPVGTGEYIACNKSVTVDLTVPDTVVNGVYPYLVGNVVKGFSGDITVAINDFTVTDVTSEELDNSLGKFGDRIKGFFDDLVESIKGFFIPSDGFFETVKDKFENLLSKHLGFLYEAPAVVVSVFELVGNFNPPETPTITLPAFNFPINGTQIHLWDEQTFTFDFLNDAPWSVLYAFYKTFVFVLVSVALINLAIKKYHNIVGGGSNDN